MHENKISEVEKFNHLRSVLEGVAYATIAGLPLNEANYKVASRRREEDTTNS